MVNKRDRSQHGLRDMLLSLTALLLIIGMLLVFNRGCSFSPGRPDTDPSTAPSVDASADLRRYARSTPFALRAPAVPSGWRATTSSSSPNPLVVRVAWITPGTFVQLSQSAAAPVEVVRLETGQADSTATGTVSAAGRQWDVYPGRRSEQAWATAVDGVTLVITGSGTQDDFRTMADAAIAASPLAR